jgi:hypothetical protein
MGTKEYHHQYYLRNQEKIRTRSAAYYRENSDAMLQLMKVRNKKRTPDEIERDKKYHQEWYEEHKVERSTKAKEDYRENADEIKARVRKYRELLPSDKRKQWNRVSVLNKFHTTEQWYRTKLAEQNGHCALCSRKREENGNRLAIDHNHQCCPKSGSCGKCLRGILCRRCNLRLGNLDELLSLGMVLAKHHTGWFARVVKYLKQYRVIT